MWQSVFAEFQQLRAPGFVVLAIAMDQPEPARPWIEAARPSYPCLIDRDHHLADLYNMVNVPQAVWIDEQGRIVRPPHTAGSTDGFRAMDRTSGAMPADVAAERVRVKNAYFDALRDWITHGAASRFAVSPADAPASVERPDERIAQAHAHFRLGQYLQRHGRDDEARAHFDEAIALHPDSWNMWRQTAAKDARGLASGEAFWARVDALGDRPYYAPVRL